MKKQITRTRRVNDMRAEYDFSGGVRGKHAQSMRDGYTITIHQPNGKQTVKEIRPTGAVILAPDVRAYFPDSDAVNTALRSLIPSFQYSKSKSQKPSRLGVKRLYASTRKPKIKYE